MMDTQLATKTTNVLKFVRRYQNTRGNSITKNQQTNLYLGILQNKTKNEHNKDLLIKGNFS
jgi:hypothetical protein